MSLRYQKQTQSQRMTYRTEVTGSLLYFAMCTRPNISYAVSTLAQYYEAPTKVHWTTTKRLFKYLIATQYTAFAYKRGETPDKLGFLAGYADD